MRNCWKNTEFFNTIIIGGGAAGLYTAARLAGASARGGVAAARAARPGRSAPCAASSILLLEKTGKLGTKLLMSGGGQCNLTHGGNIKEFLSCYGRSGPRIRTCLYQHNNLAVCNFFESLGVELTEREDGKIFPASMDAHEVRDALIRAARNGGVHMETDCRITAIASISPPAAASSSELPHCTPAASSSDPPHCMPTGSALPARFGLTASDGRLWTCRNLVIATGGCSYPATGSDGSMLQILARDLGIEIVPPAPALTPVYVENYPFAALSGISFPHVGITIKDRTSTSPEHIATLPERTPAALSASGSLLLTHRNFSGPVILNNSRYMKTGMGLEINFIFPYTIECILARMKNEFSTNRVAAENWLAESYGLPKRFCEAAMDEAGLSGRKVSGLSGEERRMLASAMTAMEFTISGLAGFGQAMATCGGVSLSQISPKTMEMKNYSGLYLAGEALDIDGDTGGYNLQFAFASAAAAAGAIAAGWSPQQE